MDNGSRNLFILLCVVCGLLIIAIVATPLPNTQFPASVLPPATQSGALQ